VFDPLARGAIPSSVTSNGVRLVDQRSIRGLNCFEATGFLKSSSHSLCVLIACNSWNDSIAKPFRYCATSRSSTSSLI